MSAPSQSPLGADDDLPAFRSSVRAWLSSNVPSDWAERLRGADLSEHAAFQRWWMAKLAEVDLATPHWPKAFGGADLGLAHQVIVAEETARANAPSLDLFAVALHNMGQTLLICGNDAQKRRFLPTVSQGTIWCQGFSEPGAGSDLASLRTRAVRSGDHYVVNGQKIWSSASAFADYCILLARTDPDAPKHKGLSYFIMDMRAPGIEVRPIRQATGKSRFAELFLNDVRIPVENRIGGENEGWSVAQATLVAERGVVAIEAAERQRYDLERFLQRSVRDGAPWLRDDQQRRDFMQIFAEMHANRLQIRRLLDGGASGRSSAATPLIVKITGSGLRRSLNAFKLGAEGLQGYLESGGADGDEDPMESYLNAFGFMIGGGTNEILRNVIAERVLGLPRG